MLVFFGVCLSSVVQFFNCPKQATIKANRKNYDDKMKKQYSKLDKLTAMVKIIMDKIQISNSSPD